MATGWHMVLGGAVLLAAATAGEGSAPLAEQLSALSPSDVGAMAYASLLGGAAAYGIFFHNASSGNLTRLSSLTFLTPVFAAAGGYWALGEVLSPPQLAGAAVTLASVFLINSKAPEVVVAEGAEAGSGGSSGSKSSA